MRRPRADALAQCMGLARGVAKLANIFGAVGSRVALDGRAVMRAAKFTSADSVRTPGLGDRLTASGFAIKANPYLDGSQGEREAISRNGAKRPVEPIVPAAAKA